MLFEVPRIRVAVACAGVLSGRHSARARQPSLQRIDAVVQKFDACLL